MPPCPPSFLHQLTTLAGGSWNLSNVFDPLGRRESLTSSAYNSPQYFLHDGGAVIGYQFQTQNVSFLTPPGGGAPALALYASPAPVDVNVPLYDIFGSTIELVDVTNGNTPSTTYTYDPGGVVTTPNNQRTPWPFLYHGLEQEYPDSWKLYWEPGGNVYNPDPFQLSLSGPQGLGGGGGAFPRAVHGPGANPQANLGLDIFDATANAVAIAGGIPICWNDSCGTFFLPGLDGLFGGDSKPTIPWYDTTHKSRGAHPIYSVTGIEPDLLPAQGGYDGALPTKVDTVQPVSGGGTQALTIALGAAAAEEVAGGGPIDPAADALAAGTIIIGGLISGYEAYQSYSKGGSQNYRHTEFEAKTDAELQAMYDSPSTSPEQKLKIQQELKARRLRNVRKRGGQ